MPVPVQLHRDRLTLTLYGWFVVWGWILYAFNPSVPRLAAELGISRAAAGLHGTATAVGVVLAGLVTARLVRRNGRRSTLVGAGVLTATGVIVLVTGQVFAQTLAGVLVLAVGANVAVTATQPALAIHHGAASSAALTEGNGVGSGLALLGPVVVGLCVSAGWGWRPGVAVAAVLALVTTALIARLPADGALGRPEPETAVPARRRRDPVGQPQARAATAFLVALVAAIAVETATTFWTADLLTERVGTAAGVATGATAGLVGGMTAIRFVVGPLTLRMPPARILVAAFLVAVGGWAVLWTATTTGGALAGLVIAGLGYGAQYPLSVALLLEASPGAVDRAQSHATFAGGAAIGIAPVLLGGLADQVGTHTAFVVVPVLAVLGAAAAAVGGRAVRAGLAQVVAETLPR